MDPIMLIELWERLRGYDKWIEAEATIQSSNLTEERIGEEKHRFTEDEPIYEWQSMNSVAWKDLTGQLHTGQYRVSENSSLFQVYDGQTVKIRYSPNNPDKFYLRGVIQSNTKTALQRFVYAALNLFSSRS